MVHARLALATLVAGTVSAAAQQTMPNWQELALRAQQNATIDKMIDNNMLSALQAEIADLKGQLAKQAHPDPPGDAEKK